MKRQKLRYYLRGLGIGVLVTAFILGIAGSDEQAMTDAQIRERALELGMVDADSIVLSELQVNDGKEAEEEAVALETQTEEKSEVPETEATVETISEVEPEATDEDAEDTTEERGEESEETPQLVTITIRSGANSYTVSKDLAEAGLIEDVGDYDTYLCDNGYSRNIRIGTYEIAVGSTEEEIAEIITGKR